MRTTGALLAAALGGGACLGACGGLGSFACTEDGQCILEGLPGTCASPGYCAFPDEACPSGLSYGKYAGLGLGKTCVPPDNLTTGGSGTDTDGSSTSGGGTDPVTSGVSATGGSAGGETSGSTSSTTDGSSGGTAECGNGVVETGEVCDGPVDNGMCRADCTAIDCNDSFGDCNRMPGDGCEASLSTADNCGKCDETCDSALCYAGGCAMLAFTTIDQFTGDLGGLNGADQKCQMEAESFGLTGNYRAWLHDGNEGPLQRFTPSNLPYVRPDGQQVAGSFDQIIDGVSFISVPMNVTLDGGSPAVIAAQICDTGAWSNMNPSTLGGSDNCGGWTTAAAGDGVVGHWNMTDDTWTWWCGVGCGTLRPLYCFEQPTL